MVKLTLVVAALVAVSVSGTRLQAQSDQFASTDQTMIVQDAQDAQTIAVDAPTVETPSVDAMPAPVSEVQLAEVQVADVPAAYVPFADVVAPALQAPATEAPAASEVAVATGPSMDAATLSPRLAKQSATTANAMRRPSRGSGVGLMILGGAALVTGLIIGDGAGTVIAVGGALIGLYGLYVYLGRPTGMEHGDAARSQRIGLGYKLNTN